MYLTRYCISTRKIQEVEAEPTKTAGLVRTERGEYFHLNADIFLSYQAAREDAERRRQEKMISLSKQLDRVAGIVFPEQPE